MPSEEGRLTFNNAGPAHIITGARLGNGIWDGEGHITMTQIAQGADITMINLRGRRVCLILQGKLIVEGEVESVEEGESTVIKLIDYRTE